MNVQRDPDAILAAWLDEGPTRLPEPTRRAIAVNTRTTTQRRRPVWMPPRRPLMNTYARWAVAAIAVVLAIGGAAYFLAPAGGQVGGPADRHTISNSVSRRRPPRPRRRLGERCHPRGRRLRLPGNVRSSLRSGADIHDRPRGPAQLRTRLHVPRQHRCQPPWLDRPRVRPAQDRGACRARRQGQRPGRSRRGDRSAGRPRSVDRKPARRDRERPEGGPGGWPRRDPTRYPDRR